MAEFVKGRGVRVEIGYTEGAPKPVLAITQSDPGVASVTAHGYAPGSVAYLQNIEGMDPVDGQAFRVASGGSPSVDNFGIEGIDTTDFPDFASGEVVGISAWRTLAQATQYQLGGGAPRTEDVGVLLDTVEKLETVKLAAETVTLDLRSLEVDNEALQKIRQIARASGRVVVRVTLAQGAQRIFRGQPSIPGESLTQGATGTGQLQFTVRGQICYLEAL